MDRIKFVRKPVRSQISDDAAAIRKTETMVAHSYYETEAPRSPPTLITETTVTSTKANSSVVRGTGVQESAVAVKPKIKTETTAAGGFAGNTESSVAVKAPVENDDAKSTTSIDSIDRELLDFQIHEASEFMESKDWSNAEESILNFLSNKLITPSESEKWSKALLHAIGAQQKWSEVISRVESSSGSVDNLGGPERYFLAKAYFRLGRVDEAKEGCSKAMRLLKKTSPQHAVFNDSLLLMSEIMDAVGKKSEARFYRSKLPEGYVDPWPAATASPVPPTVVVASPSSSVAAASEPEVNMAKALEDLDMIKKKHGTMNTVSFDTTTGRLEGEDNELLNAFHWAVEEGFSDFADLCIKDSRRLAKLRGSTYGTTPLHIAAAFGKDRYIKLLYEAGADLEVRWCFDGCEGVTPLHSTIFAGCIESTRTLLHLGADVRAETRAGETALHSAVRNRLLQHVILLLEHGASLEARTHKAKETPFLSAARLQTIDGRKIAELLLNNGADIAAVNHLDMNALHLAARWNPSPDMIEMLVARGVSLGSKAEHGWTPLLYAARYNNVNVLQALLAADANNFSNENSYGTTAIYLAALDNSVEKIKLLTESDGKVGPIDARNKDGRTALQLAALKGTENALKCLLAAGANVNASETKAPNLTALMLAVESAKISDEETALPKVKVLLSHGANPRATGSDGETAIHIGAMSKHTKLFQLLLNNTSGSVDMVTKSQHTPLHWAVSEKGLNMENIKLLVQRGANVDARDDTGSTPLIIAARQGTQEICQYLIQNGADPRSIDKNYSTPLQAAIQNPKQDVAESIIEILLAAGVDIQQMSSYTLASVVPKPADRERMQKFLKARGSR